MDAMEVTETDGLTPRWGKGHTDYIVACLAAGMTPERGILPTTKTFPPMPDVICRRMAAESPLTYAFWKNEWGMGLPIPAAGDYLGSCQFEAPLPAPEAGRLYGLPFQLYQLTRVVQLDAAPGEAHLWGRPVWTHIRDVEICRLCSGRGWRHVRKLSTGGGLEQVTCCDCEGSGRIMLSSRRCIYCGQTGTDSAIEADDNAGVNFYHLACHPCPPVGPAVLRVCRMTGCRVNAMRCALGCTSCGEGHHAQKLPATGQVCPFDAVPPKGGNLA